MWTWAMVFGGVVGVALSVGLYVRYVCGKGGSVGDMDKGSSKEAVEDLEYKPPDMENY